MGSIPDGTTLVPPHSQRPPDMVSLSIAGLFLFLNVLANVIRLVFVKIVSSFLVKKNILRYRLDSCYVYGIIDEQGDYDGKRS